MSHEFEVGRRCSMAFGDCLIEETYAWFAEEKADLRTWLLTAIDDWEIHPVRDETLYDYDTGMAYFRVMLRLFHENDVVLFKLRWQ